MKASIAWLSRTIEKGVRQGAVQNDGEKNPTPATQTNGPGHGSDAARVCITSTVPSVIDCFTRIDLRGSAEDILAACASAKVIGHRRHVTDVLFLLVCARMLKYSPFRYTAHLKKASMCTTV